MSEAAAAIPTDGKPLSEMERVVDTFAAPSKTFTDIRRNANWWVPFLLIAAFWIGMAYVADSKVGMETIMNNQLRLSPKQAEQFEKLTPEDRAKQVKGTRIFWLYLAPVAAIALGAIIAGIMMGTLNFGFGAELKFGQCLAVFMYSSLPLIIKLCVAILVFFLGSGEGFTFVNPVASNLSGLVDPNSHFLYGVAMRFDLFGIWTLVLAGIGYSCLTRVERNTCMVVVFAWWLILVLAGSGLEAMLA